MGLPETISWTKKYPTITVFSTMSKTFGRGRKRKGVYTSAPGQLGCARCPMIERDLRTVIQQAATDRKQADADREQATADRNAIMPRLSQLKQTPAQATTHSAQLEQAAAQATTYGAHLGTRLAEVERRLRDWTNDLDLRLGRVASGKAGKVHFTANFDRDTGGCSSPAFLNKR
jgi:hypothetical protein